MLSHSRLCMSLRDYRRHQYAVTSCGVSTEEPPRLFCMNKPPACQKCHCVGKDQERGEHSFSGLRGPNPPESFTGEMFVSSRECSQKDSKCNVQHASDNRLLPVSFYPVAEKIESDGFLCSDCIRSLASSRSISLPSFGKGSGSGNDRNRRRSSLILSSPAVVGLRTAADTWKRAVDHRVRTFDNPGSAVDEALRGRGK